MVIHLGNRKRETESMRITYLSIAVLDLVEIRAYLAKQPLQEAQRIGNKLKKSIDALEQFPNLGKPGRVYGTRELTVPKINNTNYIVVYRVVSRVSDQQIQILRVLPGMRDIDSILGEGFGNEEN